MALGDFVNDDYELEFRSLAMGGDTAYNLAAAEGFADLPEIISADQQLLRRDGLFPGDDFLGEREFLLQLEVQAEGNPTARDDLKATFTRLTEETPLVFQFPGIAGGNKAIVWVRPRGLDAPIDLQYLYKLPIYNIRLLATDPRIYSFTESSVSTTIATAGEGREWPTVWPREWGAASESGAMTLVNAGSVEAHMVIRFDGPVTNPSIQDVTNGNELTLNLTIADGDYVIVDTASRAVLLNGTASRYQNLELNNGTWFGVAPGTSEFVYRGVTGGTGEVTITWRSAWI